MSSCKEGKPERDGNSADGDIGGSQSDITAHLPKETKKTMGASQTHFSKRSQSRSAQGRKGQQSATTESINIAAATGGISDTAPSTARNVDASETSEFTTNAKPVERIETVTGEIETTTAKIAPTATVDVVADTATVNAFRDTATKVNTDTTESIVDDATAEVIAATATVEVMTDTVTSINGFATDEETSGAITAEEISDSAVAEEISDSATAEEISDSAKAEVISDSATAEEISESATAEEISDSAVAEEIYDSATAEEISDSAKTEEISDSATAEEISDFDTAEETSDFDTAEEISDSATTEVIAEADSATAEITDSAKCEKINGISTTNVTTEPAQTDRASEVASGKGRITTSVVTQGTTGTVAYYSSCDDRGLTEATGTRQVEGTTDVKLSKATTDTVIANSKLNAKARDFRPIEAKNTIKTETKMTEETYIASVESNPEIVSDRSRKDIGSLKTEREILLGDTGPDVAPISSKSVIGPTCSNSETVPIERITESAEPTGSNAEIGTGTKKNLAASTIDPALVNSIKEFVPLSRRAETIHASSNAEAESVFNNPYTVTVNRLASSWQTNLDRTESSEETNYTQLVYQNGNFPLYAPNIANAQFFDQNIARGAVFDQGTGNVASYAGNHALLEGNTVLLYSENAGRTNGLPAAWSFHGISNTVQTRHIPNVVPSQGMSTIFPVYDMFNNAQVTAGTQNVTAHPIQTGIVTHQMANTVPGHMVINNVPTPNMSNTALTHYTPSAFPNYGVINSVQTPRMPIVLPHHGMLNTASAHNATVSIENANGAPVRKSSFNNVSVAEVANYESPESKGAANKRPRSNYGRNSRSSSTLNRSRRASDIPPATTTNGTESTLVSTGSVSISASDSANTTDTPSKDTTLISVPTDKPFSSPAANTESNIPSNATNVMLTETTPGTSSSAATSTRSAVVNTLPTVSNISTAGAIIVPKKATHAVPTASASPVAVEVTQIAPTTSAINGSANATNDNIPTKANTSNAHTNIETESVPINTVTSKVQTRVKSNKKSTKAKASNVRNKAQTSDVAAETGTSNAPIQSKTSDVTTGAKTKVPNKAKTSNLAAEIGTDNAPIQSEISDVTTGAKTKVPIKAKTSNLAAETGTSNAPIQTETSDVTTGAKTKVPNKAKTSNLVAKIGTPIQTETRDVTTGAKTKVPNKAKISYVAAEIGTHNAPIQSKTSDVTTGAKTKVPNKAKTRNLAAETGTSNAPIQTETSDVTTGAKTKVPNEAKTNNVAAEIGTPIQTETRDVTTGAKTKVPNKAKISNVAAEIGTHNAPIQSETSDVTTGAKTKVPNKAKTRNLAAETGTSNAPIQTETSDVTTGAKTKVPNKAKTNNVAAELGTPFQTETSDVTTGAKTKVPNKAKISNVAAEIGTPIQTGTSNAQIKTARELISDSETVSAEGATAAPSTSKSTKKLPENTSSKSRAQNRKLGRNKGNERQRRSTAQRSTEVLQENVQIFKKRLSTRMQESEMKIDKVQSDVSTLEKNVANWKRDLNNTFGNESSQKVIRPVEMYVDKLRHSVSFSTDTSQAASDESCWEELAKAKTLTHELLIQIEHIIKQLKHLPLRDIALGDIRFESLSEESISKDGVNYFDGCDPIDSVASSSRDDRFTKREPRSNNTQDQTEKSKDQTDSILPSFVRSTDKVSKNRVKGRRIKKRFPEPNPNSGLGALPDPAIHVTVHPGQEGQRVNINFRKNFPQSHPPTHTLEPPTGLERLFPRTRSTRSNQPERNERHYSFSTPPTAAATESRMPNENPVIEQSNLSVSSEPVLSPRSDSFGNRQKSPQEMFDNAAPQMSHFNSALLRSGRAQMEPAKSNLLNFNMGAQTYVNDIVVEVLKALLNPWFDLLNKLSGQLQPGAHPSTVQYNQHWHSRNRRRGYNARKINRMETERGDLTVNLTNKIENVQRQLSYPDSCASNSEISLPQPVTDTDEIPISASPSEDLADLNRQRHASRSDTSVINGENSQVMSDNESHDNLDLNEQSTSQCTEQNLESHPQKLVLKIAQLQSDPTTVSESAEVLTIELDDTKLSSEALGSDVKEVGNSGMQSNTSAEPNENNEQEVQNSPVHEGSGETNMPNEPRFNESRFSQERHGLNGHELGFIPRQQQHQRYRYNMSGYDSDRGIIQPDTHTGRHMSDINPFVRQGVDGSFTMDAKRIMQQFSGASLDIQFYRETGIWRFRYGQDIGRDDCNICPDNATYYSQTGSNRNRYNSNTYFTGRETFRRQRRFAWPPKNPFLNPDNNLASVGIGNPAFYQLKPRVSQMAIVFPQMTSDKYLSGMNSLVFLEREGLLVALDLKNSFVKNFLIYESQKGKPKVVSAGSLNFTSCQPLFMSKLDSSSVIVARMQSRLTVVKCGRSLNQPEWVHDFKCMRQYSGMTYLKENVVVCSCFSQRRIDVVRIRGVEIETITRVEDLEYRPEVLCYMPTTKLLVFLEKSETDGSFLVGVTKGGDVKFNVPFDPKPENSWNITQCCDTIVACCKNTNQFRLIGSDGKNLADIDFPPHALDRPFGLVFDTKGRLYVANEGVPNNGIPPFTKPNIRVFQFSHCN